MRGRRRQPDEIKALRGNPHGHRLHLERAAKAIPPPRKRAVKLSSVEPPAYLAKGAEVDAFNAALAALPPNVARSSDVNALARWACWLRIRVECKCSPGEDLKGNHRRMRDAESAFRLEDRLGLSPAARNSIVQRLFQLPAAHFVAEAVEGEPAQPAPDDDESPLGYLARRGAR